MVVCSLYQNSSIEWKAKQIREERDREKKDPTPKASKLSMWHLKENFYTKSHRKEIR